MEVALEKCIIQEKKCDQGTATAAGATQAQ
jgi:hypothetical protein